jgi:hypothetical protein
MVPHIDSITPDHGLPHATEILIQGSGFRPNDTYVRAVMFRFPGEHGIHSAEFAHVLEGGEIRDDQLVARVPFVPIPGGAYLWVENIELLPPAPWEPKPGEIEPHDPPPPQYHLFTSNEVLFIVDCIAATRVTEATMPDEARDAVENDLLEIQEFFGGKFPVSGLSNYSHEGGTGSCFGVRTKDLKATIRFDTIDTSWSNDLWTISVTATIRATAKIDTKMFLTLCQWVRYGDMEAGGGGHRWDFTVSICSRPCTATTSGSPGRFRLNYVSSTFHLGHFAFDGVPNWAEGNLRDHVAKSIREQTLGPGSQLLSIFEVLAEKGYRQHVGGDCPPLDLVDVCAAAEAVSMEADREEVLRPLRAFRSAVLEPSAAGRTLGRLWSVLSPDLVRVTRGDPVVWGEAVALLREVGRAVDATGRARGAVLTRARYARLQRLFERSRPRLSPVSGAAGEVILAGLDRFVGVAAGEIPAVLGRWRLPVAVTRVVDRFGTLTTRRVRGAPSSRIRRKRGR